MGSRELPCPYRIIDDFGGAFGMGCFAGCIGYFLKGLYDHNHRMLVFTKKRKAIWRYYVTKKKSSDFRRLNLN
jgi:hypothetical protein